MSDKKRILFLTANPSDTTKLFLEKEAREIVEELQRATHRDNFEIKQQHAVRVQDLRRSMFDNKPQFVHFSGHGTTDSLILENDAGELQIVPTDALSSFFRLFANQVECVLLNSCYSKTQAQAISKDIKYVIGMKEEIGDTAAILFSVGFYQAIGAGFSIEDAFDSGRSAIQMENIPEHLIPVLHMRKTENEPLQSLPSSTPAASDSPLDIFYSYSHKDEKLRQKLETQLAVLRRRGLIIEWHDRKIAASDEWSEEINSHLMKARIILLLVSANFIASNYCYDIEMQKAMERHEAREARVIPIILSPCDWHDLPFASLQALPRDGKPVTQWSDRDDAFYNVALGIKTVVERLRA